MGRTVPVSIAKGGGKNKIFVEKGRGGHAHPSYDREPVRGAAENKNRDAEKEVGVPGILYYNIMYAKIVVLYGRSRCVRTDVPLHSGAMLLFCPQRKGGCQWSPFRTCSNTHSRWLDWQR